MKGSGLVMTVLAVVAIVGAPEALAQNLLQPSGWVGISTIAPGSELDVNGRIRMTQLREL